MGIFHKTAHKDALQERPRSISEDTDCELLEENTVRTALPSTQSSEIYTKSKKIGSAAAAKALQSCPTLCDPTDGSPPGSPVPGILQARALEWVAISFSSA